ncbi:hypothetical protein AB0870_08420 [Microbacterium proteolyticum]|uniref:hypothetical protein n=1 Tax=Microbacterium proteolyticum TaxID=1572644 RepID=UPI00345BE748
MGVITWDQAVDIGGGRGRLAPAPAASLARVDRDMRSAFGRAADINEAWRSPADADKNYAAYLAYLRGGPWAPIALPGDKSVHCFGYAVDTDDTSDAQMRIWNDHGWYWTVYRDRKLVERWHLEYFPGRDNHRNDPAPASTGQATTTPTATPDSEEETMKPFIAMLPGGRWVLVLPQGNGKPRAVTTQGNAGAALVKNFGEPIPFDENGSMRSLAAAVDGI